MRVIHVITRLIVGGAQENTIASVLGLHRNPDIEVSLISGPSEGPEGSLEKEFKSTPGLLQIVPDLVRPVAPLRDFKTLRQLTDIFQKERPDIVHTHSGKAGILGRLAAKKTGVPVIIHTIHGPSFGPFQNARSNFIFRSAERYAARFTTHFVSVADAMTQQYLAANIGTPDQYSRIFSGFSLEPFLAAKNDIRLRAELGIAHNDLVVGKVARLFELKGHDDLFEIAPGLVRRFLNLKFLLVGDGKWRERFEMKARRLGLQKHFIFTGLVPPSAVPRYIGIMDVLVHLSRREGLPRALPQALAAAKPVVAIDCDGAREVCLNNETGFLVPPNNLNLLKEKITELLDNTELRTKMGLAGQSFVRDRFSVQRMVADLEQLYRLLICENGETQ